jgi:hypothetical protein
VTVQPNETGHSWWIRCEGRAVRVDPVDQVRTAKHSLICHVERAAPARRSSTSRALRARARHGLLALAAAFSVPKLPR